MSEATGRMPGGTFFRRLAKGLEKTRNRLLSGKSGLVKGKPVLDKALLEDLEMQLIGADVGVETSADILSGLEQYPEAAHNRPPGCNDRAVRQHGSRPQALRTTLALPAKKPFVILVVGVNGVGKTTTIGKLAHLLQQDGRSVLLAAGDTFRAAAIEQIQHWGERVGAPVISLQPGADAAAVLYNALQAADARKWISSSPTPPDACTTRTT